MNSMGFKRGRNGSVSSSPAAAATSGTVQSSSSQIPEGAPSLEDLKKKAEKCGVLKKRSGRGLISSVTWKEKYCVLVKSRIYLFPNDDNSSGKPLGFVNLENYDSCAESSSSSRVSRKAANIFVIAASGFFDTHSAIYFAAESDTVMKEWIVAINDAFSKLRPEKSNGVSNDDNELLPQPERRLNVEIAKNRVRGPPGRRLPRKPNHQRSSVGNDRSSKVEIQSVRATVEKHDDTTEDEQILAPDDESNEDTSKRISLQSSDDHIEGANGDAIPDDNAHRTEMTGSNRSALRKSQRKPLDTADIWSNTKKSLINQLHDEPFSKNFGMTYRYSSSSDECMDIARNGTTNLQTQGKRDIRKGISRTVPRSSKTAALRTPHCITPPAQVVRRVRDDTLAHNGSRVSCDIDSSGLFPFVPELSANGGRRASSGSSLSTLTADKQNPSLAFSSLQRCKHSAGQGHSNAGRKSKSRGGSAGVADSDSDPPSATVSPVLNGCGHRRSVSRSSCSNGHKTEIAKGTSGGSRLSFEPIHSFHMLQDLGEFVFHLRQLDVDIASLRQDVGSVQENIATVRGSLDFTRERVSRLVSQVANVERQIGTIIKETTAARQEAGKLLEEAEAAKATHEHLREEAKNLVEFLRQVASYSKMYDKKRLSCETDSHVSIPRASMASRHSKNIPTSNGDASYETDRDQDSNNGFDDHSEISLLVET